MRPRRAFWFCGAASLLALGWLASWIIAELRFEAGLKKAKADMDSGRFEAACRWLAAQSARRPGHPEAAFLLGSCEYAAGRREAAQEGLGRAYLRDLPGA